VSKSYSKGKTLQLLLRGKPGKETRLQTSNHLKGKKNISRSSRVEIFYQEDIVVEKRE